ncbi:hypothetical protein PHMEG_00010816 [Phytophthora megakarya]|uniref:Uncharacterized protein n=1 Tax=Phytophthora megakarya TaxID=4795 RepID=A0A225WDQ0_9STRA|nr:hypothetical protein PHMEG_00010816 [Phytophthora megakarya]
MIPLKVVADRTESHPGAFQVLSIQDEPLSIQDYHAEDADEYLLMTDPEAGLLGREFVLRLRMAGLRELKGPRGSLSSEPDPQAATTCASSPGISIHTVAEFATVVSFIGHEQPERGHLNKTMSSIQNVSSRAGSDFVPSLFGTAGGSIESTRCGVSGSKSSQDESSSSSVWSLGQSVAGHMPFSAYSPMVMAAQGRAIQANNQMGMQVVQTVLPPPPGMAEPDDVVMSESGEIAIQSERRSKHSRTYRSQRREGNRSDGPSSGSDSEVSRYRCRNTRSHRSSRKASSPQTHSERSSRSGRYSMSVASPVALNTMHQTQEALARIQSELTQKRQADEVILAARTEAAVQAERPRMANEAEE